MNAFRGLMWALAIEAFAFAMIALFFIGPRDAGVMVAVIAAVVILVELCNALRRDRERMRRGREVVWQRRDALDCPDCGCPAERCEPLWSGQRKCCPDCRHAIPRDDAYQTSLADDFSGKWDE